MSLTDAQWAARAGVRGETLSRLRKRSSCDLSTLQALATAVGAQLILGNKAAGPTTADGHFPAALDRDAEARLLALAASGKASAGLGCQPPPMACARPICATSARACRSTRARRWASRGAW